MLASCLLAAPGCTFLPQVARQPSVYNPFPQLSKVAVAPFFNLSSEPSVDGREFALAYFNELQSVPGFEVVPVGVVEQTMVAYQISLAGPEDARKLAQILEVDAVVIGSVTDFTPYYPPRCALQVEWYAANPCYHPIPAGYGLPWGTEEEEEIPASLVFEAERSLAREQMQTQTPPFEAPVHEPPPLEAEEEASPTDEQDHVQALSHQPSADDGGATSATDVIGATDATAAIGPDGLPPNWPDPRGFSPPPPCATPPDCVPTNLPVLTHTKTYNGHDADLTEALQTYVYFRDDARSGGWQSYLQRSDDFVRFCCHLHIAEMLTARGGAGETRVVWRWPISR